MSVTARNACSRFSTFAAISLLAAVAACGGPDAPPAAGIACTADVPAGSTDPLGAAIANPRGWSCGGADQMRANQVDPRTVQVLSAEARPEEGIIRLSLQVEMRANLPLPGEPGDPRGPSSLGLADR